jgi:FkbM family methyltransferase
MLKSIKSYISSILQKIIVYISPEIYKKKYLKQYIKLSWKNYDENKVEFEMLLFPYFLNNDSVFFDVGSNIGSFVLIANKTIKQEQIFAFEPIPILNKRLKLIFPEANFRNIALSNAKSKTQFKIPKINHTQFLTRGTLNTNFVETNESGFDLLTVQTNTLDNFCIEENIKRIDVIKIDVEGHEYEVIKGALKSIEKYKPILIIEIEQRHHTEDISLIINEIKNINYSCFYFDSKSFTLTELTVEAKSLQLKSDFEKSRKYIHNFIFAHNHKVDEGFVRDINERICQDRT